MVGDSEPEDSAQNINRITSLVRKSALGRLTLPCELNGGERALVVLSGPPQYLSRKGIEQARKWIEEETGTMEVRGGDYPLPSEEKVAAVVLISGVTDSARIKELQQVAIEAKEISNEIADGSENDLETLLSSDQGDIDSLF